MKKAPPKKQQASYSQSQLTLTKNIVYLPDDWALIAVQCSQNWKGDIYVTPNGKAVHQTTLYKHTQYCNARIYMNAFGVDQQNHVFQTIMQENMWNRVQSNTSNKPDVIFVGAQGNPKTPDLPVTREVGDLDFQVENKCYDLDDKVETVVMVDCLQGSGDWITMVLFILYAKEHIENTKEVNQFPRG